MGVKSIWGLYFTDPLILFGLVLLIGFLVVKYLFHYQIIKQLPAKFETGIPKLLVSYGFVLGLLFVFLGVGLKHSQLSAAEQDNAFTLLKSEYHNNLTTIQQFSQNTKTVLQSHAEVAESLRSEGSAVMMTIFPAETDSASTEASVSERVTAAFETLKTSRMLKSKAHMAEFNAAKDALRQRLNQQIAVLQEHQDLSGKRFTINAEVWKTHRDILADTEGFEVLEYERLLGKMASLRNQYNSTLKRTEGYFSETHDFMSRNTFLGNGDVYEILIQEKESAAALNKLSDIINSELQAIEQMLPVLKQQ